MYKISEQSVLYIGSLFTTTSLTSTGKGCYKWRSSSLLHIDVCTSTCTHTSGCTHTYTQWFIRCCQQPVPGSLSSKRGNIAQLVGFRRAGLEETWRGHSIHYLSLERSASSILLPRSIFITSPWNHFIREIAQLIATVERVCCCLASTCMFSAHPGVDPRSCWAWSSACGVGETGLSMQSDPVCIQHISDARESPKGGRSFAVHSSEVRISVKTYMCSMGTWNTETNS